MNLHESAQGGWLEERERESMHGIRVLFVHTSIKCLCIKATFELGLESTYLFMCETRLITMCGHISIFGQREVVIAWCVC